MLELSVLTVGHAISAIMLLGLGLFVLFQGPRRSENALFFALTFWTAFFNIYFAIAINLPPSALSYRIWLLNAFDVFIMTSYVHFMLRAIDRHIALRWFIRFCYAVAFAILLGALLYPHLFLPEVSQKLYLKSYLNAGPLYTVMLFFFLLLPLVAFFELVRAYVRGGFDRLRSEYYIATSIVGYGMGTFSFYLVYNIQIDPILGMFIGLYTIPIAYGIVSKQLLDIRLAIKRAFFYTLGIAFVTGALTAFLILNNLLIARFPWIQFWTAPLAAAIVAVIVGRMFWNQSEENNRLKYEFLTIAMHKLRTPLTRIRWQAAALADEVKGNAVVEEGVEHINEANNRLIELTDVLVQASESEAYYGYNKVSVDLSATLKKELERIAPLVSQKKIQLTVSIEPAIPPMTGDPDRLASVMTVLLENACIYSPEGSAVSVALTYKNRNVRFSVTDHGIGVSIPDQKRIFERFYRSDRARTADTEGMGLGLSISKAIIEHYRGDIGVISEGEGKGSTFWFSIPL